MRTTVGSILFNEALPRPLRDYKQVVSGNNIGKILTRVAEKYPQEYPDAVFKIKKLGDMTSYNTAHSVSLSDFSPPKAKKAIMARAMKQLAAIRPKNVADAENQFAQIMNRNKNDLEKAVLAEGTKKNSGLAEMIFARSRGSPDQLNSIVGSPMAVQDARNKTIMVPIINSYSEGLDPAEYWAASYGTRKGILSTKVATAEGGYFGKRMAAPVHRLIITQDDCGTQNGIMEHPDGDILDCFLARNTPPFKRNDLITRSMLDRLKKRNVSVVLVRSPLTCEAEEGICSKCRGVIETGKSAVIGQNVGINSALTISEPVAQGALNVKHKGGALEDRMLINVDLETLKRLVDIPKAFPDATVLAEETGIVKSIHKAPQGGNFLTVGDSEHYIPQKRRIVVKQGERVKKGQVLTDGIINPKEVVRLRGMGPARVFFTKYYKNMYKQAYGKDIHQKHFETFTRGMLNYVNVDHAEDSDEILAGDKITIQKANKVFKPKKVISSSLKDAEGKWLAKPYLHYTVGSEVDEDLIADLKKLGINKIDVTPVKPAFSPVMLRLNAVADADSDWVRRLGGEYLRRSILKSVASGEESDIHGTSYIPGLAFGAEFGDIGETGKY